MRTKGMKSSVVTAVKAIALWTAVLAPYTALAVDFEIQTIAEGGAGVTTNAPGFDQPFDQLYAPIINNAGHVVFEGKVGSTNAIVRWDGVSLALLCKTGDQIAPGVTVALFSEMHLDDSGKVYCGVRLEGAGVTDLNCYALLAIDGATIDVIAREGDMAPDVPARDDAPPNPTYGIGDGSDIDAQACRSGYVAYVARVNHAGQVPLNPADNPGPGIAMTTIGDSTIYVPGGPTPGAFARVFSGGLVNAAGVRAVFSRHGTSVTMNGRGRIAFAAALTAAPELGLLYPTPNNAGLFTSGGGLIMFARTGDPVPGVPGAWFSDFYNDYYVVRPCQNDRGQVAFWSALWMDGVAGTVNSLWFGTPGVMFALEGDPAPGIPGATIKTIDRDSVLLCGDGRLIWSATVDPPVAGANQACWRGSPGSFELLCRSGDVAPGPFSSPFDKFHRATPGSANRHGQVVLHGQVVNVIGQHLWVTHHEAGLVYVDGSTAVDLPSQRSGGQDGLPTCLNDRGQLAYLARLGSGPARYTVKVADVSELRALACDPVPAGIRILWQGSHGRGCRVLRSTDLVNEPFTEVSGALSSGSFVDTNPPPEKAFYQISPD